MTTPDTIDVWTWDLDNPQWDSYVHTLSSHEFSHANRLHTEQLRNRCKRSRAILRHVLADYQNLPASSISFTFNRFGKPALPGNPVHFNLSHCKHQAILAISSYPVGVDIETASRSGTSVSDLMKWACHPHEIEQLLSLPAKEREGAFYRLWTQKEAYCKAVGDGLHRTLSCINLKAISSRTFRIDDQEAPDSFRYYAHNLATWPGYLATLCTPLIAPGIRSTPFGTTHSGSTLEAIPSCSNMA